LNRRTWWLAALGSAALAAAGLKYFYDGEVMDWLSARSGAQEVPRTIPVAQFNPHLQRRKADAEAHAPASPSPWVEAQKRRYLAVLEAAPAQFVVLPFQIPAGDAVYGLDATARTVMAHMTAQRLIAGGAEVADVSYVARALGEPRRIGLPEAAEFGRTARARTVVFGQAWHDGSNRLSVSLSVVPAGAAPAAKTVTRSGIEISDVLPPELAYAQIADSLLSELGVTEARALSTAVRPATKRALHQSPLSAMAGVGADMGEGIWLQQLLGVLHPPGVYHAHAALFERTLAALELMSPASADYRVLKARALVHLDRRPAAAALMRRNVNSPEERALLAFLDSNVPQMERSIADIKRPVPRLVAELELVATRFSYGMSLQELGKNAERIAKTVPREWTPLLIWYVTGLSDWNVRDTMELKLVLDAHFPLADYTAEKALQAKALMDARSEKAWAESQGLALEHVNRVLAAKGGEWSRQQAAWMPRPQQYLDLLGAQAQAMLLRRVEHVCCVQGRREEALRLIEVIGEAVFQHGNAALQARKAGILNDLMQKAPGSEQKLALAQQMFDAAKRARQWNTTDPWLATEAMRLETISARARMLNPARPQSGSSYRDLNDLKFDQPPTVTSLRWWEPLAAKGTGDYGVRLERACAYSIVSPAPCGAWRRHAEETGDVQLAQRIEKQHLVDRFQGSPRRLSLLVDAAKSRGDLASAASYARESIRTHPATWAGYDKLGSLYRDAGDYKAAAEAYSRYPRFRQADGNTVDISNTANSVANQFARRGSMREARIFHEIAARHPNGSEAALGSAFSLAMMERRFGDGLALAQDRVKRYGQGAALEAYISLLFALPDEESAWAAAREALARDAQFAPWRAVAVGLRAKGADAEGVTQWAKEFVRAPEYASSPWLDPKAMKALRTGVQVLVMDRPPASIDAARALSDLLFPPQTINPGQGTPEKKAAYMAKLRALMNPPYGTEEQGRVGDAKAYLERFVAGYLQSKRGDHKAAAEAYGHWADPSSAQETAESLYAALPYHAYSAMKAGRGTAFAEYLAKYSKPGKRDAYGNVEPAFPAFDTGLARAIVAALEGKHDLARKHMASARASTPQPGLRPLPPEYVYAEVCELLAGEGLTGYREMGLDWAKAHQAHRPWAAWAYAYEAKHSRTEADRARALAIALQLDRRSVRAGEVDANLKSKAEQWRAANEPFPRKTGAAPGRTL